jgi:hypothetical protein
MQNNYIELKNVRNVMDIRTVFDFRNTELL